MATEKKTMKSKRLIDAERRYDESARKNFPGKPSIATYNELLRAQSEDFKQRERRKR